MIDLHSHTLASDGELPPAELLARAAAAGVKTLAVTDHDTVASIAAATEAGRALGVRLVPGVELSAFLGRREVHILGHFVDPGEARLGGYSSLLRTEREARMLKMTAKMRELGFPVSIDDVRAIAGDAHLGRPHLARVLVERHWVIDVKEAFDRFLGDGGPGFVERYRLESKDAIALIRGAGGTATLAHPGVSKVERPDLEGLARQGLSGVEVFHSDHNPSVREKYLGIARALSLVPTAGSDFHGPKVTPGRHLGTVTMDPADFAELERRAARSP
ncbi:MAG: PHP domain-containing protein [Myxococcaceae bacterium]